MVKGVPFLSEPKYLFSADEEYPAGGVPIIADVTGGNRNLIIEGSILIAAASAIAYGLTLAYELGSANAFGIPYQFININLVYIQSDLLNLWNVLILPLLIVNVIPMLISNYDQRIKMRAYILTPFLFVALVFLNTYPRGYLVDWDWILIVLGAGVFFLFIWPLITQRKIKGYVAKTEAQIKIETGQPTVINNIMRSPAGEIVFLFVMFLLALQMAQGVGQANAFKQINYLVTSTKPEMAVVKIYGDNLICFPFDRKTKTIQENFTVYNLLNKGEISLRLEAIGPLKQQ